MNDLADLARDLGEFPRHAGRFVKSALRVTAHGMKDDWQEFAKQPSGAHAKAYPFSVDYDITKSEFPTFEAEIGPNLDKAQGSLGILEDAPDGVMSTPQDVRRSVVRANETDFERGMDAAIDDALRRAGL